MVRKWASRLVTAFLLLLVGFVGYCQVSMVVTMNRDYGVPSVFGYSFLYVATDSMEGDLPDSLPVGTGIVIQDVDPHSIAPGDVITFYYPAIGAPDTHRVHEISEDEDGHLTFYTRGDNLNAQLSNGQWDENYREVVPEEHYIGKVVSHSKAFGTFLTYVSPQVPSEHNHSSWLFPLLVILPLAICAAITIFSTVRQLRKEGKQEKLAIAKAMEEEGIDQSDEAAVLAFEEKWRFKKELREQFEEEKERERKKLLRDMKKKRKSEANQPIIEETEGKQ